MNRQAFDAGAVYGIRQASAWMVQNGIPQDQADAMCGRILDLATRKPGF
jgi:hypothetical protein